MEGNKVSTGDLTVSTYLRVSDNVPLIVYDVESTYSEPVVIDIIHPLPEEINSSQIVFHPKHQKWEVRSIEHVPLKIISKFDGHTVVHLHRPIQSRSSFRTYYAIDTNDKKDVQSLLNKKVQTHVSQQDDKSESKSTTKNHSKSKRKTNRISDPIEKLVENVDGYTFEHFIADLWEKQGWKTQVTNGSGDEGVDVVAISHVPYKIVSNIQVKRYKDSVISRPDIQQYSGLQQLMDVDMVAVVTSSSFSSPAEDWAAKTNVKLIDGDDLRRIIEKYDAYDLVRDYING